MPIELIAQSLKVTNWLTPIWILSIGIAIGFVFVLLSLLKIAVFSRIPFFNSVAENPVLRIVLGTVLALIYIGLFLVFYAWRYGNGTLDQGVVLPLLFVVPVSLLLGWGSWQLISRRRAGETMMMAREGFLRWMNWVCITLTSFAVLGFLLSLVNGFGVFRIVDDPAGIMQSLMRLPYAGQYVTEFDVAPSTPDNVGDEFLIDINGEETVKVDVQSNQRVEICTTPITPAVGKGIIFEVSASDEPVQFFKSPSGTGPIPNDQISKVYINNLGSSDAKVTMTWLLRPIYSEVWVIPWAAAFVLATYVMYLVIAASFPKMAAIALSTFKTEISQPLFLLVLIIGIVFMVASIYIPYNTFGEDIKMYKDSGLTLIRVLAIFLAIWAAGKSVAEEIEGRTALTVLSKPVGRRQFIFGKFAGIAMAVALLFVLLGLWFVLWTSYKPIYDAVETSKGAVEWTECFSESIRVIPALFLAFLEVVIFVAISVAISTRFGILANFLMCFAIYVLGHLTPLIVQSSAAVQAFEPVVLFGQVIAIIFPVLNHFDVQAAINTNSEIPLSYLGWSVIYTALYGTMAMLLALVLFEDRDLA
jgi:ABC-type transport system involved in multi-copper enzyme maturation permease subunit